eukprot:3423759-Rhodomonas_salina.4
MSMHAQVGSARARTLGRICSTGRMLSAFGFGFWVWVYRTRIDRRFEVGETGISLTLNTAIGNGFRAWAFGFHRARIDGSRELRSHRCPPPPASPPPASPGIGLRVWGLVLGVEGLRLRDWGLGFRVWGLGSRVQELGFRSEGIGGVVLVRTGERAHSKLIARYGHGTARHLRRPDSA